MNRLKPLWALDSGPFDRGMTMCEDALFINLKYGSFRITGQNLRIKQIKQKAPTLPEVKDEPSNT